MISLERSPSSEKASPHSRHGDESRQHELPSESTYSSKEGKKGEKNDRESRSEASRRPQSSVVRVAEEEKQRRRRDRSPSSEGEIRDYDSYRRRSRSRDRSRRHRDRSRSADRRSRSRERRRRDRDRPRGNSRSNDKENTSRHDESRSSAKPSETKEGNVVKSSAEPAAQASTEKTAKSMKDLLTTRTGGAYIPPAKLRLMQEQITDKSSAAYQRLAWEALKKSITGLVNKVNKGNLGVIVRELFRENIVRGRGLLSRCIIQAQVSSPTFTHIYAALVAVINSKFPKIGELLLRRLVIQFRRGFRRNDKTLCISSVKFIAHLVNQSVAHEILALEILTLLVENPTDDSVEVSIAFLKECGDKLTEVASKALHSIFEMLRNILHEGALDKRVQYMIEVISQVRKDGFKDYKAVEDGLDVVDEEDQFTHLITLDEATDPQDILNVFKFDADFETNEEKYSSLRKELLDEDSGEGESDSGEDGSGSDSDDSDASGNEGGENSAATQTIIDNTETNLIALRRTIYLTITSSLDFQECAHKLLRMSLKPGQESELCHMFLDCCAQQRTYEKFYGLLAQRFCQLNNIYVGPFQKIFEDTYSTVHRLETKMLRNVAKFFGHLLFTDAISWEVLNCVRLTEEDTNSSSRIFIKILFQELSEYMGLQKLNDRVKDPTLQFAFEGLFPRDDPKNTRFAINFFTSIGLGGLTDELRNHLKAQPKVPVVPALVQALPSSSSSSSSSESSSSSDSSSDESEPKSKRKRKKTKSKKKASKKAKKQKMQSVKKSKKRSKKRND